MFGFIRVGTAVVKLDVGNCKYNTEEILAIIKKAEKENIDVLTFPELCITGYTCGDLFLQTSIIETAEKSLKYILSETMNSNMFIALGMPVKIGSKLFNCAVAILNGNILGVVPKIYIPNQNEFNEKRWFTSGVDTNIKEVYLCGQRVVFDYKLVFNCINNPDLVIGMEICADGFFAVIPPSSYLALEGATVILNLSASNDVAGKGNRRELFVKAHSEKTCSVYSYVSSGVHESTTDLVFGGDSLICENGKLIARAERFSRDSQLIFVDADVESINKERMKSKIFNNLIEKSTEYKKIYFRLEKKDRTLKRKINKNPFLPESEIDYNNHFEEIFNLQIAGLAKRITVVNSEKAILGVSGGLDSTLALLVVVKTFELLNKDKKNILGITMPGFGTTDRTYENAIKLMNSLGISSREISIKDVTLKHFEDIGHSPDILDTTYENAQARERTQILMDIGNKENGLVVGTGDLSEIALGWSTYNGDHMSMYAVNAGVPKTIIKELTRWISKSLNEESRDIILDVLDTPVSPELLPPDKSGNIKQKTEDIIGPYELHDFYLYYVHTFGFNPDKIVYLAKNAFENKYTEKEIKEYLKIFYKRFITQQFKRSCMPDGPKVFGVSLSPRGTWQAPSDASFKVWIDLLEEGVENSKKIY